MIGKILVLAILAISLISWVISFLSPLGKTDDGKPAKNRVKDQRTFEERVRDRKNAWREMGYGP